MNTQNKPAMQAETTISGARGPRINEERRNRIRLSAWAHAYEIENDPLASDAEFDRLALLINPEISTGHEKLDAFFREHFSQHTGQWVYLHPEPNKLRHHVARIRDLRANPPTFNRLSPT